MLRNGIAKLAGFKTFVDLPNGLANVIRVSRISRSCMDSVRRRLGRGRAIGMGMVSVAPRNGVDLSVGGTLPTRRRPRNRHSFHRGGKREGDAPGI